jgi:hypothetical protein
MGGATGAGGATGSTSGGGGDVFLTCPVDVATFKNSQCDFLNQDCPAGQACMPVTFNGNTSTKCVAWSGVKPFGSACKVHTECKAGLFCGFYCAPPCCPLDHTPCPATCNFTANFPGGQTANICNLAKPCTLFTENACKDAYCRFDSTQDLPTCTPITGNIPEPTHGLPCMFLNDCGNMQVCVGGTCRQSCDLDKQSEPPEFGGCPPSQPDCEQYNPPIKSYPTLGFCK